MKNKTLKILSLIAFIVFVILMFSIPIVKFHSNYSYTKFLYIAFSAVFGAVIGVLFFIMNKLKRLHFIIFSVGIVLVVAGIILSFVFNILNYDYLFLCSSNILCSGISLYIGLVLSEKRRKKRQSNKENIF